MWRRENALQKWRNLYNCTLLRNLYVAKRHLLTSFEAQEAHFFAKKYIIMDQKIYTCTHKFLNYGVGGNTDEMTIFKHVLKKHIVSPTLSVLAVVHFILFLLCILKTRKKTSEYDQEIPQSYTADQDQAWYYDAFYKKTESILLRTQIVCTKMCVRFSTFCP